ncbi:MAG: MurR/RpiR family transcriptional regulator [Miniphocaeibacter sp.]|uniref:MurR/RpiR family transcriptional regulator n=1 Tax=Miniphocaeibacter sp. TaxID=3100973 RepID=UPI003BB072BF
MLLIERIEQQKNFTEAEIKISNYILNNLSKISLMTIKEVAEASQVSQASVVRFCKMLGIRGFPEFKLELNKEITIRESKDFNIVRKDRIGKLSPKEVFINTLELDTMAVNQLINTLDLKSVLKSVDLILNANTIVVYGVGASAIVAQDIVYKFIKLGLNVDFNQDFHFMLSIILNMKKNDIFIAVSTTGETQEIIELSKFAKERGAVVISITSLQKSTLIKYTDIALYTPVLEEYFRVANMATRISQLAVVDVLYMNLYEQLGDEVIDKFYSLREIVERLRR